MAGVPVGLAGRVGSSGAAGTPGIGVGVSGAGGSAGNSVGEKCAGNVVTGKLVPLDLFIMLDTSASMLEPTATGTDKWDAVKAALKAFLTDAGSGGLGVGIQYFPQDAPNAPSTCTSDAQCGQYGPCFLRACDAAPSVVPCQVDADCRPSLGVSYGKCVDFGFCQNDESYICFGIGGNCGPSPTGVQLGACGRRPSVCLDPTDCSVAAYSAPAIPIEELPGAAPALVASLDMRDPAGLTPTGPALQGALAQARARATDHPEHAVAVLFATDGLPTVCSPLEIPAIADLAEAAAAASPSLRTFVIGVFGTADLGAAANLDAIAAAGGTERAFIVDTSQNVTAQFVNALNEIRGQRLGCEFQIPQAMSGQTLDYNRVNVQLTSAAGANPLYYVGNSAAECGTDGGWYYNSDPATAAPTRIVMCPTTCQTVSSTSNATVEIQLGCTIRVR